MISLLEFNLRNYVVVVCFSIEEDVRLYARVCPIHNLEKYSATQRFTSRPKLEVFFV